MPSMKSVLNIVVVVVAVEVIIAPVANNSITV
jgi:hypothetical protein